MKNTFDYIFEVSSVHTDDDIHFQYIYEIQGNTSLFYNNYTEYIKHIKGFDQYKSFNKTIYEECEKCQYMYKNMFKKLGITPGRFDINSLEIYKIKRAKTDRKEKELLKKGYLWYHKESREVVILDFYLRLYIKFYREKHTQNRNMFKEYKTFLKYQNYIKSC